ncbi:hypothetical protein HOY82DRAFT_336189 [Tuber indicum]|nr:hypothetical protein HOY82DRAFT_336189 [Tuber indicum]
MLTVLGTSSLILVLKFGLWRLVMRRTGVLAAPTSYPSWHQIMIRRVWTKWGNTVADLGISVQRNDLRCITFQEDRGYEYFKCTFVGGEIWVGGSFAKIQTTTADHSPPSFTSIIRPTRKIEVEAWTAKSHCAAWGWGFRSGIGAWFVGMCKLQDGRCCTGMFLTSVRVQVPDNVLERSNIVAKSKTRFL